MEAIIKKIKKHEQRKEYHKNWYNENKEKMRIYHREYMKQFRAKKRLEKLEEQRVNPKEPVMVKKSIGFIKRLVSN